MYFGHLFKKHHVLDAGPLSSSNESAKFTRVQGKRFAISNERENRPGAYVGLKLVRDIDITCGWDRVLRLARVWHFVFITKVCRYEHLGSENVLKFKRRKLRCTAMYSSYVSSIEAVSSFSAPSILARRAVRVNFKQRHICWPSWATNVARLLSL